ncbi:hypothetical protein BS50DRAFT_626326 [Corynespora cassiicola Philippines]|uniref:Uncharacterized protein n=1 Tax=Corynespora cassiicola Philippines TaxID=1448308 RepID=A0A2T2N3M7_CORCC|nr:hypothetical protein BS50DRAFT_626326 [Corynespora cassiicola Philippines]
MVTGSNLSPNPFNQDSTARARLSNQGYTAGSFVQTPQVPGINRKRQHTFDLSDSDNEIYSPTPKAKAKANPQRKSDPASLLGAPRPIKRNRHGMMVLEPDPALPHTPPRPSARSIPSTPPRPMPKRTFTGLPPVSSAGESPSRAAKARAEGRIKEHFTLDAEWMEKSEEEQAREFERTSGRDGSVVLYGREQFLRDRMMGDRWVARNGTAGVDRSGVVDGEGMKVVGDEGSEFEI